MGKWRAEPLICWRNPVHPLQISPWQLSDIINRTPEGPSGGSSKSSKAGKLCCTFSWGWCVLVHFGSRSCWRWGMPQEQMPACGSFPSDTCVTCPGAHWGPVWFVCLLDKEGIQIPWSKESQAFCWALAEGGCNKHWKEKTQSAKFWQKHLLITHGPVPIQAAGSHSLGAGKGPLPAGQHLPLFLGLPQDTGMSQHPCPHAGLCLAQAAGLYSRTWVLECKF